MFVLPRNVWILTASLSLFMSLSVFVIFLGGIIGQTLAPTDSLSTLPVALLVVGTASFIIPINRLMAIIGRRRVFLSICTYTVAIIALAITALQIQSFYLFCLATFLFGATTATMNQFRFAAIESVSGNLSATATSAVLIGGLVSAFLGPEIATLGKDLFDTTFIGSFVILSSCFFVAFALLWFYQQTNIATEVQHNDTRPLSVIIKQPVFIIAISSAAVGYVVMSYLMTATPMSMHVIDGFSLEQTKFVIQSHVIAMFLPSLFTPFIVKWLGVSRMMLTGVAIYFACVVFAYSGHALNNYWIALILLGLGWNFLFIGGTSLLPRAYSDNEKFKVQSLNDFLIFGIQALASLSAGWFVFNYGWEMVLLSAVPLLIVQLLVLLWWLNNKSV
ncbi:MFS transporter [Bathymodiolus heckerae thiotrophic gill symbiont]|uniref:MFS transporter n=1 Tax=Bathymodiolus heckerae thiotrophic gill symbiont TaxID=1052212 RepID=UPI0010FF4C8E|nr:MFS transporter [Bathymodiolus heckerae thiotrophic gill symbiont]